MQREPKICDAFSARATCSSSVPSCALKPRALGQTVPKASCSLMPRRSAWSRTARIAASSDRIGGGSEIIAHVNLSELKWSRYWIGVN